MPKRFTDTEKWSNPWFRKLSLPGKLLWIFVLDKCDLAGLWVRDDEFIHFIFGQQFDIEKSIKEINSDKIRLETINTEKYLIPDFLDFQYGKLSADCRPHQAIIKLLEQHKIKGYVKGIHTLKDKDKDQDKDKVKDKDADLDLFWNAYPKKKAKGDLEKAWKQMKPILPTIEVILDSISRAKKSDQWTKENGQYIPYPATWLRDKGWLDEMTYSQQNKKSVRY